MSDDLERTLAHERRMWAALVEVDTGLPDIFDDLCRRTEPHVLTGRVFLPRYEADSAFNPASSPGYHGLPASLDAEWAAYKETWTSFLDANPRCRLADFLGSISETHDHSSWPSGWEYIIRDWVRAGLPDPMPFDDRNRIVDADWKRRLAETAETAEAAGAGWVIYGDLNYEWIDDETKSQGPETL